MSTRRKILDSINITATPSANAGLWLDKYILDLTKSDSAGHSNFVKDISTRSIPAAYNTFYDRWIDILNKYGAQKRIAKVTGRMIVGLGDESVLETSITLHHTYGVPYIPGSALKGLASSYAHQKLGEHWQKGSIAHNVAFGNTDDAGYITFFDALYVPDSGYQKQALYPDIITVHHQDYYNTDKDSAPADWDSPTPIPLLSATGQYLIALAAPDLPSKNEWIPRTFEILELALKEMGIGAKTSSGYGRMEFPSEPDQSALQLEPNDPDLQKVENYLSEIAAIPDKNVSRQIQSYFWKLGSMKSDRARIIVARAIIERVRQANIEQTLAEVGWYKALLTLTSKK